MKSVGLIRGAIVTLAALGIVAPQGPVMAADAPRAVAKADAKLAADVVLMDGAFTGRVVDHSGTPIKNREVVVKAGDKVVAKATTDDKGVFAVAGVRPGTYSATAGNATGNFRVWNESVAPPAAKGHALLVLGENGARGQFGAVDPTLVLLTGAVIATVIISAISLGKINDVEDQVSQIPTSP